MTDEGRMAPDEIPWGDSPPADLSFATTRPRRHRHEWVHHTDGLGVPGMSCANCGRVRDEAASRRGRNNRKRGNKIQRKRIVGLGGRNLAGNNPSLDGLSAMFAYESKSGGSFPKRLYRYLKGIPLLADQTAVLIVTETPGRGHKARAVVMVDYEDWRQLHGEEGTP